ncbi:hypothetical protein MMC11_008393 [Xylographa trunciseda]|nr:hypothetical protein [Xylographa trunciseda]
MFYNSPAAVVTVGIILPVLDALAVALRFHTRRIQRLPLLTDDWLTIPALILSIGIGATLIAGVHLHALGYPTPTIPGMSMLGSRSALTETNPVITITSQIEWAVQLLSIPAFGLIKLSFLFFCRRLFCVTRKSLSHIVIAVMIVAVAAWAVAFFSAFLFACKGDFAAWWGSLTDFITKCVDTLMLLYAFAISDVITDVIVLLLPLPMIWQLQLPFARKIGISCVFLLGLVAVAASVARLAIVNRNYHDGFDPSLDEDLMITEILWWTMVEVGLGLLATCLPTLRFLFRDLSPDWLLGNMRSVFSFRSASTQNSKSVASTIYITHPNLSTTSHTCIVGVERQKNADNEGFEMRQPKKLYDNRPPPGRILVRSSVVWNKEAGM